jgi:hypothetical protein
MIETEELARMFYESGREIVENSGRKDRDVCSYRVQDEHGHVIVCDGGGLWDRMHDGALYRRKGEVCPRCGGTGIEPFLSWDELSGDARESWRIRARYLLERVSVGKEGFIVTCAKHKPETISESSCPWCEVARHVAILAEINDWWISADQNADEYMLQDLGNILGKFYSTPRTNDVVPSALDNGDDTE